jgi:peptide-methionine (S)-S-oxide reductase
MKLNILLFITMAIANSACGQQQSVKNITMENQNNIEVSQSALATFGSGCFWCTEAIFQQVSGVQKVVSGYAGGKVKNPTYKEICSGLTGHAEVVQITYNPSEITYPELLEIFWQTHDPTTLNKQGADVGTQYRSVIFFHTNEQRDLATSYKNKLNQAGVFTNPIVTEISPAPVFYLAEDYHQNYFNLNGDAPYCTYVIQPKLDKFKRVFKEKLVKK